MSIKNVLHTRNLGRLDIFKTIAMSLIDRLLHRIATRHLNNGRKQLVVFSFDFVAQQINLSGVYEIEELDTFFQWIKPLAPQLFNGLAIDIGANIGNHSLYFSDLFKKVYSYEPNLRTFKVLNLNSELANNITCFNFGISNNARNALLNVNPLNIGGAGIVEEISSTSQGISLKPLDSVISELEKVNLIKIDVEGHEFSALQGAKAVIGKNCPVILFEQHPADFRNNESKVINLLKEYGYSQFVVIQKTPRAKNHLNPILRWAYASFVRFLWGAEMQIRIENNPEPGFYFFIAAIPDSIKLPQEI